MLHNCWLTGLCLILVGALSGCGGADGGVMQDESALPSGLAPADEGTGTDETPADPDPGQGAGVDNGDNSAGGATGPEGGTVTPADDPASNPDPEPPADGGAPDPGNGSTASCDGVTCSGHGICFVWDNKASCLCFDNYQAQGLECIAPAAPLPGRPRTTARPPQSA